MPLTSGGKLIVKKVVPCKSLLSKAKGLMFSPKLDDSCLLFIFGSEAIVSFHMLFVFFPIDMLFLDSSRKIVDIKEHVRPFTQYISPERPARSVIELPAGTVRLKKLGLGRKMAWEKNI